MDKSEILAFISKNPVSFLATVENNKPHVRGILICYADEAGIIFITSKRKDFYKQLSVNPSVELCFYNKRKKIQIRVSGTAELTEDMELKKKIAENFPAIKTWVEQDGYNILAPYQLKNCLASVWTNKTDFEPKEFIEL